MLMRSASRPGSTPAAMVHAASDRRPCGTEHALRLFSDHGIAAAASSFETGAVYYRDVVAAGADELLAFKLVQSGGHAGPADAEHKGEIFVRERHPHPSCAPLGSLGSTRTWRIGRGSCSIAETFHRAEDNGVSGGWLPLRRFGTGRLP